MIAEARTQDRTQQPIALPPAVPNLVRVAAPAVLRIAALRTVHHAFLSVEVSEVLIAAPPATSFDLVRRANSSPGRALKRNARNVRRAPIRGVQNARSAAKPVRTVSVPWKASHGIAATGPHGTISPNVDHGPPASTPKPDEVALQATRVNSIAPIAVMVRRGGVVLSVRQPVHSAPSRQKVAAPNTQKRSVTRLPQVSPSGGDSRFTLPTRILAVKKKAHRPRKIAVLIAVLTVLFRLAVAHARAQAAVLRVPDSRERTGRPSTPTAKTVPASIVPAGPQIRVASQKNVQNAPIAPSRVRVRVDSAAPVPAVAEKASAQSREVLARVAAVIPAPAPVANPGASPGASLAAGNVLNPYARPNTDLLPGHSAGRRSDSFLARSFIRNRPVAFEPESVYHATLGLHHVEYH